MGYKVKDKIEVAILIDDKEVPLEGGNTLNFLHLAASTKILVPTFHFSVVDILDSMATIHLEDGASIQIILTSNGLVTSRFFTVNSWNNPPNSKMFNIDGYFSNTKFRIGTADETINGTSDFAFKAIAEKCGMKYEGTPTNDSQSWVPRNRRYCEFVTNICNYGYVNDESHMMSVVDSLGVLRYRNTRAVEAQDVYLGAFGYDSGDAYAVDEYNYKVSSGHSNSLKGYRNNRVEFSTTGETKKHDKLTFTPDSNKVLVNEKVRDEQERGSYSYSPIGFGNQHPNSEKARYQNSRFDALKSMLGQFLIFNPTFVEPLDGLNFSTSPTKPAEEDGVYNIGTKIIYIQGNTYVEKLVGYKEGLE